MKNLLIITLLLSSFLSFAQFGGLAKKKEAPKTGTFKSATKAGEPEKTDVYYFEQANAEIDKRGSYNNVVFENINKAIEINPDNENYRVIRALCLLSSKTQEHKLLAALDDLNFALSKEPTPKAYNTLALVHFELAEVVYKGEKDKQITHYKTAIDAYKKMSELSPDKLEKISYKIKEIDNKLSEL